MREHPGFDLDQITGRSMIRLRVRPSAADAASTALQLPQQALQWLDGDPATYWLGPDQWLLTSDNMSAEEIIAHVDSSLSGQLYAATDNSSQNACFSLTGPAARMVLAMGCGLDVRPGVFQTGQCTRTHFANVLLFIAALDDNHFDLYVDRSHARYLSAWFGNAGEDPITRDSKYYEMTVS
jgi:sarcosine oxidase subunit gamma